MGWGFLYYVGAFWIILTILRPFLEIILKPLVELAAIIYFKYFKK